MSKLPEIKVLSIRQPWAHLIVHGSKNIENRPMRTHYRGWIAIHSSKALPTDWDKHVPPGVRKPKQDAMALGAIVGVARIVDCLEESESRWFVGEYGWVLKNRKALAEPIPWKGKLGLWKLPRSRRVHKAIGKLIGVK